MKQKRVQRTYFGRFLTAASLYVIFLAAVVIILRYVPSTNWNILLAILPAVPLVYGIWAYSQFLDGIDELQRLIHTKSVALAAGVASILTFTYGLLESFADFPVINLLWVFPLIAVVWGIGLSYYGRKYG